MRIRSGQRKNGEHGAAYFGHHNGSPARIMMDQIGMYEMGLMFDALGLQPKTVQPLAGKPQAAFHKLIPLMLPRCADVPEALAMLAFFIALGYWELRRP